MDIKEMADIKINIVFPIIFILFLFGCIITPIFEWVSFNIYHKPMYAIFGKMFYFPFWFFIFNQYIVSAFIFTALFLCALFFNLKKNVFTLAPLFVVIIVAFLFTLLIYYNDIKDIINDNYIVENVSVYEMEKSHRRGGGRRRITPKYNFKTNTKFEGGAYEKYLEIDIFGYRTITEFRNNLKRQFIIQHNLDKDSMDMIQYYFDIYINSNDLLKEWLTYNEIKIYYTQTNGIIFKYELIENRELELYENETTENEMKNIIKDLPLSEEEINELLKNIE